MEELLKIKQLLDMKNRDIKQKDDTIAQLKQELEASKATLAGEHDERVAASIIFSNGAKSELTEEVAI